MRKLELSLLALVIAAAPLAFAQGTTGCAALDTLNFNAALQPNATAGQQTALANVYLTTNANGNSKLHLRSLGLGSDITNVQLYNGNPSSGGTLLQTFNDDENDFAGGRFSHDITLDPNLVSQISANPSNYYWAVNTGSNGTLIGQLGGANTRYFSGTMSNDNGASGNSVFSLTPMNGGGYTLGYDLNTTGAGNSFDNVSLSNGSGTPINLATNASGTNGRFTGSANLTNDQARQFLCNPSTYTLSAGSLSGGLGNAHEMFIPIAGSANGSNGSNWKTDVTMFNNSVGNGQNSPTGTANTVVQFYRTGDQFLNSTPLSSSQMIAPRGMSNTRDISTNMFNSQFDGLGAMRVVSSDNIVANARIYNDQSSNGKGTFGQYISGIPRSGALSAGVIAGLSTTAGSGDHSATHSNIAMFNPNDTYVTVSFELRDSNGNITGRNMITLPPNQMTQIPLSGTTGLFNSITGDVNTSSLVFVAGQPIFVLGSVVDDASGDSTIIQAQSDDTENSNE